MRTHYQTDIGKIYHYFPYNAYVDTSFTESTPSYDVFDLIPPSITNLLLQPVKIECPVQKIKARYLEVFDLRSNRYIIECPKPWVLLPNLLSELTNDVRLKGYVAHGETNGYVNLRLL